MDESTTGEEAALIPTGRALNSYACIRSLGKRGIGTVVASELPELPHYASRYCSERHQLAAGPTDVPGYRDALLALAARPDVKTAFPVREADAFVFAKYADAFAEHVSLAVPDAETLALAHDRIALAEAAAEAGVPYPETRLLSEVDTWDRPTVVKSRYNILTPDYVADYPDGRMGEVKNVSVLGPGEAPDAEALREEMGHDPIVQEFVPQAEKFLYGGLWDDGEPVSTYQHRVIRQNSWVGGGDVYRESAYDPEVEQVAHDLLSQLGWTGFACIEYLRDAETGEWKFLEINPRIWQSLPEAVRAGVDFPYHYWQLTQGASGPFGDDYRTGVKCHIAYGELGHLLSVRHDDSPVLERPSFARTFWDIASSCVRTPRFDYIRADDPKLFLSAVRTAFSAGSTRTREFASGDGSTPRTSVASGASASSQSTDGGTIE